MKFSSGALMVAMGLFISGGGANHTRSAARYVA
jgi:hypothetical protein